MNKDKQKSAGLEKQEDGRFSVAPTQPRETFNYNDLVWIQKPDLPWWPGFICDSKFLGKVNQSCNRFVLWLGDACISQENIKGLRLFKPWYDKLYSKDSNYSYMRCVVDALKIQAAQFGVSEMDDDDLFDWAESGFPSEQESNTEQLPEFLVSLLTSLKGEKITETRNYSSRLKKSKDGYDSDEDFKEDIDESTMKLVQRLITGEIKMGTVCLVCQKTGCIDLETHPIFDGGLCFSCREIFLTTEFAIDAETGIHLYCQLCCSPGYLLYCKNVCCRKACCEYCLRVLCDVDPNESCLNKNPGLCLVCSEYSKETHGMLKKRQDWQARLNSFFHPGEELFLDVVRCKPKPIKVLCCYDSQNIGRLALEQFKTLIDYDFYHLNHSHLPNLVSYDLILAVVDEENIVSDAGGRTVDESAATLADFIRLHFELNKDKCFALLQVITTQVDTSRMMTRFLERYPIIIKNPVLPKSSFFLWTNIPSSDKIFKPFAVNEAIIWEEQTVPSKVLKKKMYRTEAPNFANPKRDGELPDYLLKEGYITSVVHALLCAILSI